MEPGFSCGQSNNLPKVDLLMVAVDSQTMQSIIVQQSKGKNSQGKKVSVAGPQEMVDAVKKSLDRKKIPGSSEVKDTASDAKDASNNTEDASNNTKDASNDAKDATEEVEKESNRSKG